MRLFVRSQWLLAAGAFIPTLTAIVPKSPAAPAGADEHQVDYLKEVRPILSQHCFQCHGPDEAARKGKLRLDLKDDAFAARKGKHVFAPKDPGDSLAWDRITTDDEKKKMPPEGKAEPLTEKQITLLKTWIEQGAQWKEHWAFTPPVKPPVPEIADKAWARDPMDAFVAARMEKEGLKPEAEAPREAWLRRVSFDLTGIGPTPAEIDEFLKDKSEGAYEKVVDRLLASPRYGERQAQEWLDLARYADTGGYQNDQARKAWKWREWVIQAFNADMPFDQFTIEQLAGDLLPNATLSQKVATGFNRNHPTNSEAGEEEDEYRSAYVIDRVNTTSTVFMGLTMACTQCHDHKYDPLTQRDYYSFYSFFNNVKERDSDYRNPRPTLPVPNPDQEPRLADVAGRKKALEERLEKEDPLEDEAQKDWQKRALERLGEPIAWTTAEPAGMLAQNGSILKLLPDGSVLSSGPAPVRDTYNIVLQPGKKKIAALRLEVLPDDSQPSKATGRASDGRFILSALELRNSTISESQEPPLVYISKADADLNQKQKEDPNSYDESPGSIDGSIVVEPVGGEQGGMGMGFRGFRNGWSIIDEEKQARHEAILVPLEPLELNEASVLRLTLHFTSQGKFKSLIGRFRVSYTEDARVRAQLMPAQTKLWSSIGPFPAEDLTKAFETAFDPEKDLLKGVVDTRKNYDQVVLAAPEGEKPADAPAKAAGDAPADKPEKKESGEKKDMPKGGKPDHPKAPKDGGDSEKKGEDKAPDAKKPEEPKGEVALADAAPRSAKAPEEKPAEEKKDAPKADEAKAATKEGKSEKPEKADEKKEEKGDKKEEKKESADEKPRKRPERIAWTEQAKWRDAESARVENTKNAAFYFTRKIVSTAPRTAMLKIDGPAGFKIWLNGEPLKVQAPPPPPPAPAMPMGKGMGAPDGKPGDAKPEGKGDAKPADAKPGDAKGAKKDDGKPGDKKDAKKDTKDEKKDKDEDEGGADFNFDEIDFSDMMGTAPSKTETKFRIGLRQGDNELVVKAVFAPPAAPQGRRFFFGGDMGMTPGGPGGRGGQSGSFTFDLVPEGDDLLNHEVVTALRASAAAPASRPAEPPASSPAEGATAAAGAHGPNARGDASPATGGDDAAKTTAAPAPAPEPQDAKKVSLVGEIAAPLMTHEAGPKLTPEEKRAKVLRTWYRTKIDPIGRVIADELAKVKDEEKIAKREIPETLVMDELPADKQRKAYIFKRGLYKNKGDAVDSNTPAILPPMAKDLPHNRLGLAKWLVSKEHPLTARVLMNRIWKQYFGAGLVRTPEDFGVRCELPTHPELLDYLATELVDGGWSMKKMHKRIVLSATYRQSSTTSPEKLEKDAENRLLARGPHLRLTAEMVRDHALATSGLLYEKIGGESVKPFQPKGAWKIVDGNGSTSYKRDKDEKQYRRGLYVYWKRGSPYPSMMNFDSVKRDACTVTRAYTTTPLQALTLLNDPVYVECAKMLGQRMLKDKEVGREKTDATRIAYGFRLCTSRKPTDAEIEILTKLLKEQREQFKGDGDAAKKLLAVGDAKIDEKLDAAEAAAWATVGNALLNLDETIRRG